MYALAFKNKILIKGSYREVLDHCFILRKEQGYLLSDPRYKLLNLETGESVCGNLKIIFHPSEGLRVPSNLLSTVTRNG